LKEENEQLRAENKGFGKRMKNWLTTKWNISKVKIDCGMKSMYGRKTEVKAETKRESKET
jgi:hypothetical protein